MDLYLLQNIYRRIDSRAARLTMLKSARLLGMRTLIVRMDTNNYCNLRCIMCKFGYEKVLPEQRIEMTVEQYEKIAADIFPKTRSLHLSCGYEPLVVSEFDHYLRVAKQKYGVPFVSFATNAMAMRDHHCKTMIEAGVDEIVVSADGAKAETFESVRRGGKFDRLLNNLAMLRDMKKAAGAEKPVLRLNYTFLDANVEEIPDFIDLMAEYGMQVLELRPVDMNVIGRFEVEPLLTESARKTYDRLYPEIQKRAEHHNIELIAFHRLPEKTQAAKNNNSAKTKANSCILPYFALYILADGSVKSCVSGPDIGNIIDQSYAEIMASQVNRNFQKMTKGPNQYCDRCQLKGEMIG